MAQQPRQVKVSEINVSSIKSLEERVFLLHSIIDKGYYCQKNAKLPNTIDVYIPGDAPDELSDFDFFYDNLASNRLNEFHYLDKNRRGELFVQWRREIDNEVYQLIYEDFTKGLRDGENNTCDNALPFCTSNSYNFAAGVNAGSLPSGVDPYYCPGSPPGQDNCLSTSPNPAFYYMRIQTAGNLDIYMYSNPRVDIDFDCWGPFDDLNTMCSQLSCSNLVDCSYSTAWEEHCYINNAQVGQYYVLLITNYSNSPCDINFSNTTTGAGAASTDCTIVTNADNTGPYCVGETIQLTINSVLGASYYWTHPATGFTSTLQNPTISNCTMADGGTYICAVTVGGQTTYASTQVEVYPDPTANFTFVDNICAGSSASFTSTSTTNPSGQTINSYSWTFGDGQTGSGASVSHNYNTPGDYQVTLAVSTGGHCTDQITKTIHVRPQPTASFTATTVCQGNPTQFTSTSTGQNITGYQWNFGDGQSGTGQTANHTYSQAGTYQVTLTVTTSYGCTDQITQSVTVNEQPTASFTATTVCQGQATQFTSTSTGQNITSYQWNFGDGQTGTGPNPTHTYAQAGTYQVILSVESAGGCFHQVTQTVTVNAQPTANFSATTVCQGQATQFTNASTGQGITGYQWNFGDNTTGTGQNPTHTYSQAGSYQVTLTVTTSSGCSDVATQTVIVNPQVHVNITVDGNTTICEGDTVTLHANVNSVNLDFISPGDILCTDNSIVKPSAWPVSGKTAKGIVFYVDNSGAHGWAVNLTQSSSLTWGSTGLKGTAYNLWRDAVHDMNGAANTQNIKASTSSSTHPAAWNPDASQGWYLPAIGQLGVLYGELVVVNASLSTVGGTGITDTAGTGSATGNFYIWSSTEKSAASAYAMEVQDGQIGGVNKANPTSGKNYVVRAIIDF